MNYAAYFDNLVETAGQKVGFKSLDIGQLSPDYIQQHTTFSTSGLGMQVISYYIENQVLEISGPFKLYAGFQKLSRFMPQRHRYANIARLGQPIYIFGEADAVIPSHPNLSVVYLDDSPDRLHSDSLQRYWFVVLDTEKGLSMALLCRELARSDRAIGKSNRLMYRNFEGFWTFDKAIVQGVAKLLDHCIEEYGSV